MPTISSFNPMIVKFAARMSKEEKQAKARQILMDPNSTPEEVDEAMTHVTAGEAKKLTMIAIDKV